jgi:hypothetical protein
VYFFLLLSIYLCISLSLYLCISFSHSISLFLSFYLSLSLSIPIALSLYLSLSLHSLNDYVHFFSFLFFSSPFLSQSFSLFLFHFFYLSHSFVVTSLFLSLFIFYFPSLLLFSSVSLPLLSLNFWLPWAIYETLNFFSSRPGWPRRHHWRPRPRRPSRGCRRTPWGQFQYHSLMTIVLKSWTVM